LAGGDLTEGERRALVAEFAEDEVGGAELAVLQVIDSQE
jgi:hypothetical protein